MKEELIRDKLVVGIKDTVLTKCLQLDPDLTLEKAKKEVRQKEEVREHKQVLKEGESKKYHIQIDVVQLKWKHQKQSTWRKEVINLPLKARKHCTRYVGDWHPELSSKICYLTFLS